MQVKCVRFRLFVFIVQINTTILTKLTATAFFHLKVLHTKHFTWHFLGCIECKISYNQHSVELYHTTVIVFFIVIVKIYVCDQLKSCDVSLSCFFFYWTFGRGQRLQIFFNNFKSHKITEFTEHFSQTNF